MKTSMALLSIATLLVLLGCETHLSDPGGPSAEQILSVDIKEPSLEANGVSVATVSIEVVLKEFRPRNLVVTVRTTGGTLIAGQASGREVQARLTGGVATVALKSDRSEALVRVTVSAESITVEDTIRFEPAEIEQVYLQSDVLSAPANGTTPINLTATLQATSGEPTIGTTVEFRALDLMNDVEVRELRRQTDLGDDGRGEVQMRSLRPLDLMVVAYPAMDPLERDTVWVSFSKQEGGASSD